MKSTTAQPLPSHNDAVVVSPARRQPRRRRASAFLPPSSPSQDPGAVHDPKADSSKPAAASPTTVMDLPDDEIQACPPRHQEAVEQWAALVTRETDPAYAPPRDAHDVDGQGAFLDPVSHSQRHQLAAWVFNVADHTKMERSVAASAMANFDRLVQFKLIDKSDWSLSCLTCLFTAAKLRTKERAACVSSHDLAVCGAKGGFTAGDIEEMELEVGTALGWRVTPPVAAEYVDVVGPLLMDLGRYDGTMEAMHYLVEQARYLSELSVLDGHFSALHPSSVAYASLTVAMELMAFPSCMIQSIASLPLEHDAEEADLCAARLRHICAADDIHPVRTFDACLRPATECHAAACKDGPRAVTPTKGEVPPSLKKARREAILGRGVDARKTY